VSPAVDLLVGCGGWTLPLAAVVFGASRGGLDVAPVFYALALVCNYPHYAATIARAYGSAEARIRHRLWTLHVTALLAVLAALAGWVPWLARALVTVYLTWSPWHYTGQNFGIALLLARRAGISVTQRERTILRAAFVASFVSWLLWMHGTPPANADVLSLGIPAALALPARVGASVAFAVLAAIAAVRLAGRAGLRTSAGPLVLLGTQALWFVVPTLPGVAPAGRFEPAYFSAGVLAVAHCAQYLWITGWTARREDPAWSPARWAALVIVVGAALFIPVPWIASRLLPLELTRCLVIVAAVVNVHHFVLDGVIWRLRDPRVAGALLATREPSVEAPAAAAPAPRLPAWARATLAAAVLGVALVDQLQYHLTRDGTGAESVRLAGRLAPHDARVLVREAETQAAAGARGEALNLLDRTLALDPLNAVALRERGILLVQAGRFAEAAAHYAEVERRINPDLSTLVNAAVLAARAGDLDRARARLEHALALDPTNAEAHLDLAEVDMLRRDPAAAVPHFHAYLARVEAGGTVDERTRGVAEAVRRKLDAAETALAARGG
jgi:Flp pilus assembly protein TadD